ncbi:MAG: extracellular solute-binding protein, partial [Verrucomicrobiota bacterium]
MFLKNLLSNPNSVGIILVAGAMIWSLWTVSTRTQPLQQENRVVRILHWQLEPGYREAFDMIIEDYNNLPHVREAGYEVKQIAVTERVYAQFLNVHIISGTAPDLCLLGMSKLAQLKALFFENLDAYVNQPNPYNTDESLPEGLDPETRNALITRPWKETFFDGLKSGFDDALLAYYGIPISSWGSIRIYYNKNLVREAKQHLIQAFETTPQPEWLTSCYLENGGFIVPNQRFKSWMTSDSPPETLGQLVTICSAIKDFAEKTGRDNLVPISGSKYGKTMFLDAYATPFTYTYTESLDANTNGNIQEIETLGGWQAEVWDFDDKRVSALFELAEEFTQFFPTGFLGLDREQAIRRFILKNAAMVTSGSWDAGGIFQGANDFEVGIMDFPLPAPEEKWGDLDAIKASETGKKGGGTYGLYKGSKMQKEAVDFMRFLTSMPANEKFNRFSGTIPVALGAEAVDRIKPFELRYEGLKDGAQIKFHPKNSGDVGVLFFGQYFLFMEGSIDYLEFTNRAHEIYERPRTGINRLWFEQQERERTLSRLTEQTLDSIR